MSVSQITNMIGGRVGHCEELIKVPASLQCCQKNRPWARTIGVMSAVVPEEQQALIPEFIELPHAFHSLVFRRLPNPPTTFSRQSSQIPLLDDSCPSTPTPTQTHTR